MDCSAGTSPNTTPASTATSAVKASTVQSGVLESDRGVLPVGRNPISAPSMSTARTTPSAPPAADKTRLSTSNCRISRARLAPSASRTAISFCRADARAISRLARLEQAISKTRATIAINANKGFEYESRR